MLRHREAVSAAWYRAPRPVLQPGHQVVVLETGAEFFPALEAELASASDQVFLETYIFQDDRSGRRIARALADAARRGVRVHLVVDGFGTGKLSGEVARLLHDSGVSIQVFRPEPKWFSFDAARLRRLHRKLAVIDGRCAFVGGINLLDDYFDPNHGVLENPRLDFAVRVQGPLVAQIHLIMQRLWWDLDLLGRTRVGPSGAWAQVPAPPADFGGEPKPAGRLRAMLVLRDNFRYRRTIERIYLRGIHRCSREILIANAYFFPGVRFRRALLAAAARGVKVTLLLQGRVEYRLQHYASQALYDELLLGGIEIVEYQKSFLHAKVAVIDDWATVGSSNIDPFSLLLAREANVVVSNHDFAADLRGRLQRAIADGGTPIALHHHERRPWPVRVMNWFAYLVLRAGVSLTGLAGRF